MYYISVLKTGKNDKPAGWLFNVIGEDLWF